MLAGSECSPPLERRNLGRWAIYESALLALCAGLVIWQLFVPPALGVADNGDYARLSGRV